MQVKVTYTFRAVRPEQVYPVDIPVGEILTGELANIALDLNCGEMVARPDRSVAAPDAPLPPHLPYGGVGGVALNTQGGAPSLETGAVVPLMPPTSSQEMSPALNPPTSDPPQRPALKNVARARVRAKYEGPDDKGQTVSLAKGAYVEGAMAQFLVDNGVASVVEIKA